MDGEVGASEFAEGGGLVVDVGHPRIVGDFVAGEGPEFVELFEGELRVGVHDEAEVVAAEFAAVGGDVGGFWGVAGLFGGFFFFERCELAVHVGVDFLDELGVAVVECRPRCGGEPLDAVDPRGAGGEPGTPDDAVAPDHADGVVLELGREHVAMRVEPILQRGACLEGVAHDSGGGEVGVAECFAEEDHAGPAIEGFAGGFLVVAVGEAVAVGKAVAAPNVERAEEGEAAVGAVVVGVSLGDGLGHFAVGSGEVGGELAHHACGKSEVAVVEMVVGEVLGAVAGVEADEPFAARVVGEEAVFFSGGNSEPVLQLGAHAGEDGSERRILCLPGDEGGLSETGEVFASGVGVACEAFFLGEVGGEIRLHALGIEAGFGGGEIGEDAVVCVGERELVADGAAHLATDGGEVDAVEREVVFALAPVVWEPAVEDAFFHALERLGGDSPSRRAGARSPVVGPRELGVAGDGEGVLVENGEVACSRERAHDEVAARAGKCDADAVCSLLELRAIGHEHTVRAPFVGDAEGVARHGELCRFSREVEERGGVFSARAFAGIPAEGDERLHADELAPDIRHPFAERDIHEARIALEHAEGDGPIRPRFRPRIEGLEVFAGEDEREVGDHARAIASGLCGVENLDALLGRIHLVRVAP